MEAAGAVDAQNAPTAPWNTPRTRVPQLPQGVIRQQSVTYAAGLLCYLSSRSFTVEPPVTVEAMRHSRWTLDRAVTPRPRCPRRDRASEFQSQDRSTPIGVAPLLFPQRVSDTTPGAQTRSDRPQAQRRAHCLSRELDGPPLQRLDLKCSCHAFTISASCSRTKAVTRFNSVRGESAVVFESVRVPTRTSPPSALGPHEHAAARHDHWRRKTTDRAPPAGRLDSLLSCLRSRP